MLIPKLRLHTAEIDGQEVCVTKYYVYDTDECGFIENRTFTFYDTEDECQKAIDFFNSFEVVKIS